MDAIAIDFFNSCISEEYNRDNVRKVEESKAFLEKCFEDILKKGDIRTFFQPIVSFENADILGYEALSRGPVGSPPEFPDILFGTARSLGRTWDLESLCRTKALTCAKGIFPEYMLFLNVDPNVIYDEKFIRGFTKKYLNKYNIDPENIIFEITEKSSVNDFKTFKNVIDNYKEQGYKIAIDDVGAGYSGLSLLAEIRPQYLKIDMSLIRDVDKDGLKQALLKTLYDFCLVTNIKMIAEGIETVNELNTLIDIGVHYGQGYFIQRPSAEFKELSAPVKKLITDRNKLKRVAYYHNSSTIAIGDIAKIKEAVSSETSGMELFEKFNKNPNVRGIPVVDHNKLKGLVMKDKFFAKLGTKYGVAIFMNRPIALLMNRNPLVVDYYTPLDQVSKLAMARKEEELYDYVVIIKKNDYYGIITVKDLLEKSMQLKINYAKHLNALTGLPGNNLIEKKILNLIDSNQPYTILYIDADNFKSYNDVYGFENGDKLIQLIAQILCEETEKHPAADKFVGHIGGDDFIVMLNEYSVQTLCDNIIRQFDTKVRDLYKTEDVAREYIIAKNRHGEIEKFPLVTISLAGITNRYKKYAEPSELAEAASKMKKTCKLLWCSCSNIE